MCKIKKVKIELNLNTPNAILELYINVFKDTINNIVRLYSVYVKMSEINENYLTTQDFYELALINIRKLFDKKMLFKFDNDEIGAAKQYKYDYNLNFDQWINLFRDKFSNLDLDNPFHEKNKKQILKSVSELKSNLNEFEHACNDNIVKSIDSHIIGPVRTRIYNYASKFVAHTFDKRIYERENFIYKVLLENHELENIVRILSNIENSFNLLNYYWINVGIAPEIKNVSSFEDTKRKYFKHFLNEVK